MGVVTPCNNAGEVTEYETAMPGLCHEWDGYVRSRLHQSYAQVNAPPFPTIRSLQRSTLIADPQGEALSQLEKIRRKASRKYKDLERKGVAYYLIDNSMKKSRMTLWAKVLRKLPCPCTMNQYQCVWHTTYTRISFFPFFRLSFLLSYIVTIAFLFSFSLFFVRRCLSIMRMKNAKIT
jgi:hypothetical protein